MPKKTFKHAEPKNLNELCDYARMWDYITPSAFRATFRMSRLPKSDRISALILLIAKDGSKEGWVCFHANPYSTKTLYERIA